MTYCQTCNLSLSDKNYIRHCNTKDHLKKEIQQLYCEQCKKHCVNETSFNRHKYTCHNKNINTYTEINTSIIVDTITKVDNKITKVDNNVKIIKKEVREVKTKVNNALTKATSLIKYLILNFPNIPSLEKIDNNEYEKQLRLDYTYDENTFIDNNNNNHDSKYKLEIILINDYKRNIFIKNICKTILDYVNHKNPDEQPIYNTDANRNNYIIKINTNWNEDIYGHKFKELVIGPILKTIENLINKYRIEYLEKSINRKNHYEQNIKNIEWLSTTFEFEIKLHTYKLMKPILKELSSHLRFTKYISSKKKYKIYDDNDDEFTKYDSIEKIKKRLF